MPAVAQILLLLAALAIPAGDATTDSRDRPPVAGIGKHRARILPSGWICQTESRGPVAFIGLLGIALYMSCWFLGLMPVITVRRLMASGIEALFERGRPTQGERDFRLAADFDAWSPSPCERLAELEFQHWLAAERDQPEVFDRCLAWQQSAIARDPRNPAGYRALGEFYLSKASRGGDSADATAAANAFRRAAGLYPNHAVTQAQLAEALQAAGEPEAARQAATRALELDGINERAGHVDKRLPPARSRTIGEILRQDSN
ncbi:MAG: hypothetical protein HY290_01465 [Planctomycetia bacterium]|nr:hypothetical protein [Planctomycetia bacterium]